MHINQPLLRINPLESTDSIPHQPSSRSCYYRAVTPGLTPSRRESGIHLVYFNLVVM